ncbi:unnamed protein product [Sphagnum jensenii]|uniref:NADH dehydrogenase [ubiquinone] 1 alpha subcomplex subunit 1 n=1 Tax=Sphagnum jensenii TaxID=128206 RepID=A0ABP1AH48_9BRYO
MSWESMLPMAVISAMIFVMANSQDVINRFTTGKPKHPRNDAWDRAMDERDARIKEEATRAHQVTMLQQTFVWGTTSFSQQE